MENIKFVGKPKRDFLKVLDELPHNISPEERKKHVQIGDYLDIKYEDFLSWSEFKDEEFSKINFKKLPEIVRVSILEINNENNSILIETGNIKKEIDLDIFLNYKGS
jgi:hypothetical protein